MRAFIAIDIPEYLKIKIDTLQQELKKSGAHVRWTNPKGIHLTLKFLGEIKQDKAQAIIKQLEGNIPSFNPFTIKLKGLGGFPDLKHPRVVWLGAEGDINELKLLYRSIESNLESLGFPREKRDFNAHLTLARVKSFRNFSRLLEMIEEKSNILLDEFTADSFYLFQSILKPTGAEYNIMHKFMLKK